MTRRRHDRTLAPPAAEARRPSGEARRPPEYGVGLLDSPTLARQLTSGGVALGAARRARAEAQLGAPIGPVTLHTHSRIARGLGAKALAFGGHVHTSPGELTEDNLLHELRHVQQQRAGRVRADSSMGGVPVNLDARLEAEADGGGGPIAVRGPPSAPVLQARWYKAVEWGKKKDKRWIPKGKSGASEHKGPGDFAVSFEVGAEYDDETGAYKSAAQAESERMAAQKAAAKRRRDAAAADQERRANARVSPRTVAKRSRVDEEQEALVEQRRQDGTPVRFEGGEADEQGTFSKRRAIQLARDAFNAQLVDQSLNTLSEEAKERLTKHYEAYKDSAKFVFLPQGSLRPVLVVAKLDPPEPIEGKQPPEPAGQVRGAFDDRGHLATESLIQGLRRDQANDPKNIIAENGRINQGFKRGLELAAQELLVLGHEIVYVAEIQYAADDALRPASVRHSYVIDGGPVVTVELLNPER